MKKCLVIGSTVCDVMLYINHLPQRQDDIHLYQQKIGVGGCAYNVVSILHHLGIDYTFISPVGTGVYGDFIAQELQQSGIHTPIRVQQENGCCYCLVEADGERTFMSYHGAEYTFDASWLDNLDLSLYDYLYICGLEVEDVNGEELVAVLSHFKGQLIFCPGPRGTHISPSRLEKIYAEKPLMHLNDKEIMELTGQTTIEMALSALYQQTQQSIILTCGQSGAIYFDGITTTRISGVPAKVVDTIGAGDSHIGGVMAGLAVGKTMAEAVQFANHVASYIVSTQGVALDEKAIANLKTLLQS